MEDYSSWFDSTEYEVIENVDLQEEIVQEDLIQDTETIQEAAPDYSLQEDLSSDSVELEEEEEVSAAASMSSSEELLYNNDSLSTPINEMSLTNILLYVIITVLLSLTALNFGRSLL